MVRLILLRRYVLNFILERNGRFVLCGVNYGIASMDLVFTRNVSYPRCWELMAFINLSLCVLLLEFKVSRGVK
jgi:hypothetical protein